MAELMGFNSEKQLFQTAVESVEFQHLARLYPNTTCLIEPSGLFGIPDLVIASLGLTCGEVKAFAFEMKLSNWQRALVQAFRYRSFAEISFVVMDHKNIKPALACLGRFEKANIGLLSFNTEGELFVHYQPRENKPYCERTRAIFERLLRETELGRSMSSEETDSPSIPGVYRKGFASDCRLTFQTIVESDNDISSFSVSHTSVEVSFECSG